jgi:eukaryotic-like serine/threonine-protein kinase
MNLNKQSLQAHIKSKKNIDFSLGKFEYDSTPLGQGGNGIAYKGKINNVEVAVKFLVLDENAQKNKTKRFIAEYINVLNANSLKNIVKYFNFDIFLFVVDQDTFTIPVIIMKLYCGDLKKWKSTVSKDERNFIKLFDFLLETIESIHKAGIIHRDIKPENILFDENESLVLADFGIANYNPQMFAIANLTEKGERVGNREFSAPEQEKGKVKAHETMDIYAMGQVLQWFATGTPHRGTGRKRITEIEEFKGLNLYDSIISQCLNQDVSKRFQSIQEIRDFIEESKKKYPMNYIQKFHDILQLSFPKAGKNIIKDV